MSFPRSSAAQVPPAPAPAPAAPAAAPAPADVAEARARFAAGVEKFQAGDFTGALGEFERAFALRRHPAVRINIANCLLRLGRAPDAVDHFVEYLRESPNASVEQRAEVERSIAEARHNFAEVRIVVNVAGAQVTVDGDAAGQSPLGRPLRLRPGSHLVDVRRAGYTAFSERVELAGGPPRELRVDLAEHPGIGLLVVESTPVGATVRLDGRVAGRTPLEAELETGTHRVQVERGEVFWLGPVRVGEANTTRMNVSLPDRAAARSVTPLLVGGGLSAAALVAGIALGLYALNQSAQFDGVVHEIEGLPPGDPRAGPLQQRGEDLAAETRGLALGADLALLAAVIGAGLTAYWYWRTPVERQVPGVDIRMSFGRSGGPASGGGAVGSVQLGGRF